MVVAIVAYAVIRTRLYIYSFWIYHTNHLNPSILELSLFRRQFAFDEVSLEVMHAFKFGIFGMGKWVVTSRKP